MRKRPEGADLFEVGTDRSWNSFFHDVDPGSVEALDLLGFTSIYPAGAVLYAAGQASRGIFLVCRGSAKLCISSADGRTLITKIAQPGQVLGLSSSLAGNLYKATAETLEPSQVNFVRREDLIHFLSVHHSACATVIRHLANECEADADHIRAIELSRTASEKLATLILSWCVPGRDDEPCRLQMLLTHEHVSQLIGTSRETVTRLFKQFRDRNLISIKGATLTVIDRAGLRAIAVV